MKTPCCKAWGAALFALLCGGAGAQALPQPLPVAPATVLPLPAAPPPGQWTEAQLQQAFSAADSDGDERLNRAESQQLLILPRPFEEMDLNKDGVLARTEYQAAAVRS